MNKALRVESGINSELLSWPSFARHGNADPWSIGFDIHFVYQWGRVRFLALLVRPPKFETTINAGLDIFTLNENAGENYRTTGMSTYKHVTSYTRALLKHGLLVIMPLSSPQHWRPKCSSYPSYENSTKNEMELIPLLTLAQPAPGECRTSSSQVSWHRAFSSDLWCFADDLGYYSCLGTLPRAQLLKENA